MSTMNIKGILLDNRYRIVDKIGVGGMADVYLGEDTLLGRQVAIKVLHANFANDDEFVTRFKREAQAAGKLNHPNRYNIIVAINCGKSFFHTNNCTFTSWNRCFI